MRPHQHRGRLFEIQRVAVLQRPELRRAFDERGVRVRFETVAAFELFAPGTPFRILAPDLQRIRGRVELTHLLRRVRLDEQRARARPKRKRIVRTIPAADDTGDASTAAKLHVILSRELIFRLHVSILRRVRPLHASNQVRVVNREVRFAAGCFGERVPVCGLKVAMLHIAAEISAEDDVALVVDVHASDGNGMQPSISKTPYTEGEMHSFPICVAEQELAADDVPVERLDEPDVRGAPGEELFHLGMNHVAVFILSGGRDHRASLRVKSRVLYRPRDVPAVVSKNIRGDRDVKKRLELTASHAAADE
mmetsp:Transcript_4881/g.17436  ORF Transcript_4881/g.17436 Transcript_4881/m.17436 type:complete len:308 (-) Transcript_4881:478-1401(-)